MAQTIVKLKPRVLQGKLINISIDRVSLWLKVT